MAEYTQFGMVVKTKLLTSNIKTQEDLRKEVNMRTGLKIDSSRMSKILKGIKGSPKVISSICDILDIQNPINN